MACPHHDEDGGFFLANAKKEAKGTEAKRSFDDRCVGLSRTILTIKKPTVFYLPTMAKKESCLIQKIVNVHHDRPLPRW